MAGRPVYVKRTTEPEELQLPEDAPGPEPGELGDAYRETWIHYLFEQEERRQANYLNPAPEGWNPVDHIPEGLEMYADELRRAESPEDLDVLARQLEDNLERKRRREERGFGSTILADLFVGVFDPSNLVAIEAKGASFGARFLRGALEVGSVNAATEVARVSSDPLASPLELAVTIPTGAAFGGVLGGAFGRRVPGASALPPGEAAASPARLRQPQRLTPVVQGNFRVTSTPGQRRAPVTRQGRGSTNHAGVDIATPQGTPVYAAADGEVREARARGGYGNTVQVAYGDGTVIDRYAHLSRWTVRAGQRIRRGQVIGYTGSTGRSTGPHLHWERTIGGRRVNPLDDSDVTVGAATPRPGEAFTAIGRINTPWGLLVEGRGIPVVEASDGSGRTASYMAPKSADEIEADARLELEEERAAIVDDTAPATEEPLIGSGRAVRGERTLRVPVYAAQKGRGRKPKIIGYREIPASEIDTTLPPRKGQERPRAAVEGLMPDEIDRLAGKLEARADGLEKAVLRSGNDFRVKDEPGKPRAMRLASELRERAEDLRAEATYRDGHFVVDAEGEKERWVPARDRARPQPRDEDLAELGRLDAELRAEDEWRWFWKIDDLPFGAMPEGRVPPSWYGEHIRIDADQARRDFAAKVWTRTAKGIDALPADAFKSVDEYTFFAGLHETYHSVVPRLKNESVAAYENRINRLAFEQFKREHMSYKPSSNLLQHLAIAPTPMGQMERLLGKNGDAEIMRSLMDLAGDMAFFTARAREGAAVTPGGSVFQRAEMWLRHVPVFRDALLTGYSKAIGAGNAGRLGRAASRLGGKAFKGYSLAEFEDDVIRAIVGVDKKADPGAARPDVPNEAREVAQAFRDIMTKFEATMREVGVVRSSKDAARKAEFFEKQAGNWEKRAAEDDGDFAKFAAGKAEEYRTQAAELREQAAEQLWDADSYYPVHWDVDAIERNKAAFLDAAEKAYAREGVPNPRLSAEAAYEKVTSEPVEDLLPSAGPRSLKTRTLSKVMTPEEYYDFIVRDPTAVLLVYARRIGAEIEMTRRFGDGWGQAETDRLLGDMIARGIPEKKRQQAMQLWFDARDRIVGNFHGKNPLSWDNRMVRSIKMYGQYVTLGGVVKSQLGDIARVVMTQGLGARLAAGGKGPAGLYQGIHAVLFGDAKRFGQTNAKIVGEAIEYAIASVQARLIEADTALFVTRQTRLERWLQKAQKPFFVVNLLTPLTVLLKEATGAVAAHNLIEDARLVAGAIRAGTEPNKAARARLAKGGIDPIDAAILADAADAHSEVGTQGLTLVNIDAWEAEGGRMARAAEMLRGAVNGEIRRGVITPGPLDKPAIFDGVIHSGKQRAAGWDRYTAARGEVARIRGEIKRARATLGDEADAQVEGLLELLKLARGEETSAFREIGKAARQERPFYSLPFQLKSFMMASGGKMLHGLLSGPERNRLGGFAAMFAMGALSYYLKNKAYVDSGKATWSEALEGTVNQIGLEAWLGDLYKNVEAAADLQLLDQLGIGQEYDPEGRRIGDEAGPFMGPAVSSVFDALEGMLNGGMATDDRLAQVAGALPFNNLVWLELTIGKLTTLARSIAREMPGMPVGDEMVADQGYVEAAAEPQGELMGMLGMPAGRDQRMAPPVSVSAPQAAPRFEPRPLAIAPGKGRKPRRPRQIRLVDVPGPGEGIVGQR